MKISEIIVESRRRGSVPAHQFNTMGGAWIFRDPNYRDHGLYRAMMAAGMSDGKSTKAQDMDAMSWHGTFNTAHPYTEHEHRMVQSALKTVGVETHHVVKDHRSREQDGGHRVSPVQARRPVKHRKPKR